MENQISPAGCCPQFDPAPWQDNMHKWDNKPFIKAKVFTLFYIPINFGSTISKLSKFFEKTESQTTEFLCLSDHTSKWNMDLYLAVDKPITDANNTAINGNFYSKVYEGNLNETGKWCKDIKKKAKEKGLQQKSCIYGIQHAPNVQKHTAKIMW